MRLPCVHCEPDFATSLHRSTGHGGGSKKRGIRTPVPCVTFIDQAELLSLCLSKTPRSGQGWMESRWNHGSLFLMFRTVGLSGYMGGESARAHALGSSGSHSAFLRQNTTQLHSAITVLGLQGTI